MIASNNSPATTVPHDASTDRLRLDGISKSFSGHVALDKVNLHVKPGEVHGLVGENGAGKSTLLNILSGVLSADSGNITIDGKVLNIKSPLQARTSGIAMIHQELQHVPELSVAQNMFLGRSITRMGGALVNRRQQERVALEVLSTLDPDIDPSAPIRTLKVAQRQLIEIARALMEDAKVIAMDEPTSSLTPAEFQQLARLIEDLSTRGVSIIYVSHKMNEIFEVCSRATILRDGRNITVATLANTNAAGITASMVGRDLVESTHVSHASKDSVLEVKNLSRGKHVKGASFTLHRGEVLGIAGLVGAGRTELLRLIAGIDRPDGGTVHMHGNQVAGNDPRAAIRAGMGLLPEERKRDGIIRERPVTSNVALPSFRLFTRLGLIKRRKIAATSLDILRDMDLRPLNIDKAIGTFSGGNQQKVIIGRWLAASADIMLFDEPTRGIDVGAKSEIYALVEKLAAAGKAIIVVSSEMPELIRLADRVLVMSEGSITGELQGDKINEGAMLELAIATG